MAFKYGSGVKYGAHRHWGEVADSFSRETAAFLALIIDGSYGNGVYGFGVYGHGQYGQWPVSFFMESAATPVYMRE